jgi:hypothetical protein
MQHSRRTGKRQNHSANQLTGIGTDFLANFSVTVPVGVERMDYLGREVLMENTNKDSIALSRRMNDIERVWATVPLLAERHADHIVTLMGDRIVRLRSIVKRRLYAEIPPAATHFLDDVDLIEQVFTR